MGLEKCNKLGRSPLGYYSAEGLRIAVVENAALSFAPLSMHMYNQNVSVWYSNYAPERAHFVITLMLEHCFFIS